MNYHLLLGLLLLGWLSACGKQMPAEVATNQDQAAANDPVVARIKGLEFTHSELEQELAIDRATYKLTNSRELVLQDLDGTLQGLIPSLLLDQQAQQAGIYVSDEELLRNSAIS
jgi:hypothetical protein